MPTPHNSGPKTWQVEIIMRLGKEKVVYSDTVDLRADVRACLSNMGRVKDEAQQAIETAYQSILSTASQHFVERHNAQQQKTHDEKPV